MDTIDGAEVRTGEAHGDRRVIFINHPAGIPSAFFQPPYQT
jgi:hypothetical protein